MAWVIGVKLANNKEEKSGEQMSNTHKKMNRSNQGILDLNVIDLILIDHRFLKECIQIFGNDTDHGIKLRMAKSFLEAILLHSKAERKAIYNSLKNNSHLHFHILHAETEHDLIEKKAKGLKRRFNNTRVLKAEVEKEMKALSDLLSKHLNEEENETLPKLNEFLDDESLRELGKSFMLERKFSALDIKDYPELQDELIQWKDSTQKISSEFLAKMDKFVENMQH